MAVKIILIAVISYLLGNLNGSILISRLLVHDDVRKHGSGNAGFTNFFRNYGGFNSVLVILIDLAKAAGACLIGKALLGAEGYPAEGAALAAAFVGLGHDFPALLGFKGGKGIMCGIASAAVLDWRVAVLTFGVFLIVYLASKYVSLASICGAFTLGISYVCWHVHQPYAIAGTLFMCALAVFMHRENISRLVKGTERKTDFFKKEKKG